jgi:hypothetical protein
MPEVAECLEELADLFLLQQDGPRAARFAGAASNLRDMLAMPVPIVCRRQFEQRLTKIQALLGDDHFMEQWNVGRSLTYEEAIAEAVQASEEPIIALRLPP